MLLPCRDSSYFCSLKIINTYSTFAASTRKTSSNTSYSTGVLHLFSGYRYHNIAYYIRGFRPSRVAHTKRNVACVHKRFFLRVILLMVRETLLALKSLLHSAQGILTAEKANGVVAIQSLHVWSHTCLTSRLNTFEHALHTYLYDIAQVIFTIR